MSKLSNMFTENDQKTADILNDTSTTKMNNNPYIRDRAIGQPGYNPFDFQASKGDKQAQLQETLLQKDNAQDELRVKAELEQRKYQIYQRHEDMERVHGLMKDVKDLTEGISLEVHAQGE